MELFSGRISNAVHWIRSIPAAIHGRYVRDNVANDDGRNLFCCFHWLRHLNRPIAQCLKKALRGKVLVGQALHDFSQVAN